MTDPVMEIPRRTHRCGDLSPADAGSEVLLAGWVAAHRDLGGLTFVDLRDRFGVTQVVLSDLVDEGGEHRPADIRAESVIAVRGTVRERPADQRKGDGAGAIEVEAAAWRLVAGCEPLPFDLSLRTASHEETRLTHRYLDLRRPELMDNLVLRHRAMQLSRRVLDDHGFLEIETPVLTRSTPEGARDFLVPSRQQRGGFYALPQSPQLFKQLLMVAGADRYMQIVRCFRDEDLRADRQPEFTQIDLEMSFVQPADVMAVAEELMATLWRELRGVELPRPFSTMPHAEAIARYGSDKPDLRFGMELIDVGALAAAVADDDGPAIRFDFVRQALADDGICKAIVVAGGAELSRKRLDGFVDWIKQFGLGGMLFGKIADDRWTGPAAKAFSPALQAALVDAAGGSTGDLVLVSVGPPALVHTAMDRLRRDLAAERGLIPDDAFACCWIVDFPLVEYDEEAERHVAVHHPFTMPAAEDLPLLESDPGAVRAQAYDLVCNGVELGGGSLRIHDRALQDRMFRALGIDDAEADEKFGFLRRALAYGAPPHGGLAFGFDRMVAMLSGTDAIRDVIAFPKTTSASCPMTRAPAPVDAAQLRELHLRVDKG